MVSGTKSEMRQTPPQVHVRLALEGNAKILLPISGLRLLLSNQHLLVAPMQLQVLQSPQLLTTIMMAQISLSLCSSFEPSLEISGPEMPLIQSLKPLLSLSTMSVSPTTLLTKQARQVQASKTTSLLKRHPIRRLALTGQQQLSKMWQAVPTLIPSMCSTIAPGSGKTLQVHILHKTSPSVMLRELQVTHSALLNISTM